jgi:hypothetical protein
LKIKLHKHLLNQRNKKKLKPNLLRINQLKIKLHKHLLNQRNKKSENFRNLFDLYPSIEKII